MSEFITTAEDLMARKNAIQEEIALHPTGDNLHEVFSVALSNVHVDMQNLWESDTEGGESVRFALNSYAAAIVAVNETVERGWISEEQSEEQIDRLVEDAKSDSTTWRNIQLAKGLMDIAGASVDTDVLDTTAKPLQVGVAKQPNDNDPSEDAEAIDQRTKVTIEFDYESGYVEIGSRRVLLSRAHTDRAQATLQRASLLESIAKWNNEVEPGTRMTPKQWWTLTFEDQDYDKEVVGSLRIWMQKNLTFRRQQIIGHTGLRGNGAKYISGDFSITLSSKNKPDTPAEVVAIESTNEQTTPSESPEADPKANSTTEDNSRSIREPVSLHDPEVRVARRAAIRERLEKKTLDAAPDKAQDDLHEGYKGNHSWRLASNLPPAPTPSTVLSPNEAPTPEVDANYDEKEITDKEWDMIEEGEDLINEVFAELAVYFRTGHKDERIKPDRLYHLKQYSSQHLGRASEKNWISRETSGLNLREAMRLALVNSDKMLNLYGIKRNRKLFEELIDSKVDEFKEQKLDQSSQNY